MKKQVNENVDFALPQRSEPLNKYFCYDFQFFTTCSIDPGPCDELEE